MSAFTGYELVDDVAYITLKDGKVNVMSVEMMKEIDAALRRSEGEARVTVLRSAEPGMFSAGFDLKTFAGGDAERLAAMVRTGAELALKLLVHPMPTVGIMAGHAFPMGAFLLLACDLRIGASGPYRVGLNEVTIGIVPPGFAIELARSRLHPAWLSRTVTLGEMYEPDGALLAGFLDEVVPLDSLERCAAERIAVIRDAVHLPSHRFAKRRLRADTAAAMRRAIDAELAVDTFRSSDAETGS